MEPKYQENLVEEDLMKKDLYFLEESTKDEQEKQKKRYPLFRRWSFIATSLLLLGSLINYLAFSSNSKLRKENRELYLKNILYRQKIENVERENNNLKRLNQGALIVLIENTNELIRKMPVRGMFSRLQDLVGGIGIFNNNPMSTQQLEKIVQETQSYPSELEELKDDWKLIFHGIRNYIPKNLGITLLPIIKDEKKDENGENTTVNQDFGNNYYVLILGQGIHEGIDISNKEASKLYSSFNGKILEDRVYKGKGRTISILADYIGKEGEMYKISVSHLASETKKLKKGQKIKKEEYFGNTGITGFVSGQHAHVESYVSYDKGKKWELYYPYENGTYLEGENIVWYVLGDNPEELPEQIRKKLEGFLTKEKK